MPASFGLILASEQIVNALFGYGSFIEENIQKTALALKYFAYGVPAFALIKILSNLYFARDNTKTPFHISILIVTINIIISLSFFSKVGFIIIPIATSVSTWLGVFIYVYLLQKIKWLLIQQYLMKNFIMIIFNSAIMALILIFSLDYFGNYLEYTYKFKSFYLLLIVGFVAVIYLILCYLSGLLKLKNFKTY